MASMINTGAKPKDLSASLPEAKPQSAREPASKSDPANASSANTDHTKQDGTKPQSATEALLDPDFLPTLEDAPLEQKAKSHSLLVILVLGAVLGAWFFGYDLLQIDSAKSWTELGLGLGAVVLGTLGLLYWTGTGSIDLWSLVVEWGWYSLPVAGGAALLFVILQEKTEDITHVD
jgi:hypothetical protein